MNKNNNFINLAGMEKKETKSMDRTVIYFERIIKRETRMITKIVIFIILTVISLIILIKVIPGNINITLGF